MTSPNILLISTDQQRYDSIGANGSPHMITPALDQFASEAVCLDQCYIQGPVCMPSRASIWTGRYPLNHGVTSNGIGLPKQETTLANVFQDAGYATANVGKLHFLPHKDEPHDLSSQYDGYGYDINEWADGPADRENAYYTWIADNHPDYVASVRPERPDAPSIHVAPGNMRTWVQDIPDDLTLTAWTASRAFSLLEELSSADRPFFLSVGFFYPHHPLNPTQRWLDLYDGVELPPPTQHPDDIATSPLPSLTLDQWDDIRRHYYALCSEIDHYVGRILAAVPENTIVIYMSDHGEMLGDHARFAKGPSNYDEIIRVPCMIRMPGVLPAGRRVDGFVETVDLLPTLCDLCGVDSPAGVDGQSMTGLLKGETDEGRTDVMVQHRDETSRILTLRTPSHKYFRYADGSEKLFDLSETGIDYEVHDRADDQPEVLADLRDRLLQRLVDGMNTLPVRTHRW